MIVHRLKLPGKVQVPRLADLFVQQPPSHHMHVPCAYTYRKHLPIQACHLPLCHFLGSLQGSSLRQAALKVTPPCLHCLLKAGDGLCQLQPNMWQAGM